MTKGEMEVHAEAYRAKMGAAMEASNSGLYFNATRIAVDAWEDIDGTFQLFRARDQASAFDFGAIKLVLMYAPLLLDPGSIDRLEAFIGANRRIQKELGKEQVERDIAAARKRVDENFWLWNDIESRGSFLRDEIRHIFGVEPSPSLAVLQSWEAMGLIRQEGRMLGLSTRLGAMVPAKCPSCGSKIEAPKAMLLDPMNCPECRNEVAFVLLANRL